MVAPDPIAWVDDILDCIGWIERLTAGRSVADYRSDRVMRDVVERNVENISEASRRLPENLKAAHPQMNWRQIAHVGNILPHAYRTVDHTTVWDIVELDLPALREVVEIMRRDLGRDP